MTEQPVWIRAAVSAEGFAHEQAALGKLWAFVGLVSDIPEDGDWFRATVGGRSIFVQRFDKELRAFENRCAHRFYPLRTADHGNGPIVCGFHHWRYNREGRAVGIPMCKELFGGAIPRDLDLAIPRLDLDCCGDLIFVRLPQAEPGETLREFLAEGFPILERMCSAQTKPLRFRLKIDAHWKFSHHISLDDYHIVAVHPTSFGKGGYLKSDVVNYYRFGRHSAFLETQEKDRLNAVGRAIADGSYRPSHYAIFNIFPNFLVSQFHTARLFGSENWYISVMRYVPVTHDRSEAHVWMFKAPFPHTEGRLARMLRPYVDRFLPPIVARFARKIMIEDNDVCEGQQRLASQVEDEQVLSAQEERIGWFEDAYRNALGFRESIAPDRSADRRRSSQ